MRKIFCVLVGLAVVGLMAQDARAQIVPFNSVGTGNAYDTGDGSFGGPGITAHMGKSSGGGFAAPVAITDPEDPDFGDPLVSGWVGFGEFVAANGDTIEFAGGGKIFFEPDEELGPGWFTAAWIGEFNITGGTGRFSNVGPGTAPLSVIAINDPFQLDQFGNPVPDEDGNPPIWTYDYTITGDMDLGKKGKKK